MDPFYLFIAIMCWLTTLMAGFCVGLLYMQPNTSEVSQDSQKHLAQKQTS